MRSITSHALGLGYKEFIYYAPVLKKDEHENIYAQNERYRGFLDAAQKHSCSYTTVLNESVLSNMLRDDRKCAVICPSDIYALSTYNLVRDRRLSQVKVFGFDNSDMLDKTRTDIDSVSYDRNNLVEQIYKFLNGTQTDDTVYIPYNIVVRK